MHLKLLNRLLSLSYLLLLTIKRMDTQQSSAVQKDVNDAFSPMPIDLPVRRIYVHGRPVYVRQMTVEPQRPDQRHKRTNGEEMLNLDLDGIESHAKSLNATLNRHRRFGFAPMIPVGSFAAPSASGASSYSASNYPSYARYSPAPAAQYQQPPEPYYYPSSQPSSAQLQQNYYPTVPQQQQPQTIYVPAVQQQQTALPYQAPQSPAPQPLPYHVSAPQPLPALPPAPAQAPQQLVPPEPLPTLEPQPQYPLPECYTDDSNFMCCNNQLEQLMKDTYNNLVGSSYNFNRCNVQKMANSIQKAAEERFNTTFEVLAGVGDYASKSHFFQNYICKVELEGRYLLAYASPKPETEEEAEVENPRKEPGYRTSTNHIHSWR